MFGDLMNNPDVFESPDDELAKAVKNPKLKPIEKKRPLPPIPNEFEQYRKRKGLPGRVEGGKKSKSKSKKQKTVKKNKRARKTKKNLSRHKKK